MSLTFKDRFLMYFERLLFLVPTLVIITTLIEFYFLISRPNPLWLAIIFLTLYGAPLALFRFINLFAPMKEGLFTIGRGGYNPWLGAFKIQIFYTTFPALEKFLMLVPGAFSLWLRLWGSDIGKRVFWATGVEVVDRTHLKVGDRVFFGNKTYLSPHVVRRKADMRLQVFIKRIEIGDHAFIGAGSRLGPGTKIAQGVQLEALTDLFVKEKVGIAPEV